ncbi:dickkopf-related protein 2 [Silurus meridionalis]|uniref:Dickkopf-related protein 2 n=1 Tax=Silurus meridionalis TaxID=175797 RepID=A0A8T0BXN2_SILME|nr:dickkopf-related protein 2 [Silurus meridionalis]KAF7710130.1 hypothetical protein HF521_009002 [Silurus meridionalis]KAI5107739.1 dickkopf-related protein 2 precursor [Silurus meridionalis]
MLALTRSSRCCCLLALLLLLLRSPAGVKASGHSKNNNSIKTSPLGEASTTATAPAAAAAAAASAHPDSAAAHAPAKKANVPEQLYSSEKQCSSDKDCAVSNYCHSSQHGPSRCVTCRRRKKRCHRDAMCCPGNRCSNFICVAFPENLMTHHISPKEQKKLSKDKGWKKNGKVQTKVSLKGHEGDSCLRSSDCSEGYCCARHFWTKICKPVLRQGEVCTKQRKKGSHNLEIFQRCDCAKGLVCKVWKDATSYSKSRLHVCQRT